MKQLIGLGLTTFTFLAALSSAFAAPLDDTTVSSNGYQSSSTMEARQISTPEYNELNGFKPFLGGSVGYQEADPQLNTQGFPFSAKFIGSLYLPTQPFVIDGGVGIVTQFFTESGPGPETITSPVLEVGSRYRFPQAWEAGLVWYNVLDHGHRFGATSDNVSFIGPQILKVVRINDGLFRFGGRIMQDTNIHGEQILSSMIEVHYNWGATRTVAAVQEPVENIKIEGDTLTVSNLMAEPKREGLVRFDIDSADVKRQDEAYLQRLSRVLAANSDLYKKVEVVGHTDYTGTEKHNLDLSKRRAREVASFFAKQRELRPKTVRIGMGEADPIAQGTDPASLYQNRRVELKFTGATDTAALESLIKSVR